MRNLVVHYKNKFPGALVQVSENALDVFVGDDHKVALRKDGAGMWVDCSAEYGCSDKHDLAPIPKDARVFKEVAGKVALDELHEERKSKRDQFIEDGKVLSCEDLKKKGFVFDEKQRVISGPKA